LPLLGVAAAKSAAAMPTMLIALAAVVVKTMMLIALVAVVVKTMILKLRKSHPPLLQTSSTALRTRVNCRGRIRW